MQDAIKTPQTTEPALKDYLALVDDITYLGLCEKKARRYADAVLHWFYYRDLLRNLKDENVTPLSKRQQLEREIWNWDFAIERAEEKLPNYEVKNVLAQIYRKRVLETLPLNTPQEREVYADVSKIVDALSNSTHCEIIENVVESLTNQEGAA